MSLHRVIQTLLIGGLIGASVRAVPGIEVGRDLCPGRVATLTPVPGNLDAQFAAERVEIRQCVLNAAKLGGWVQLVAWERGAVKPGLIIDTEDSGFYQIVVIQGVYAFEIMGGKASQVLVISFEQGKPKIVLNESTLAHPTISTDSEGLSVNVALENGQKRDFHFKKTGLASGRK